MRRTPLYPLHRRMRARFVPFAGWEMPLQFSSVLEEARAVRRKVGVFDVSHMGRIFVSGPRAEEFLEWATTNRVSKLTEGRVQYSLLLNERGGTLDDVTVYRLGPREFMLVVNAANREKVLRHLSELNSDFGCRIGDKTEELVQLAVQGPEAKEVLEEFFPGVSELRYYSFGRWGEALVSRTGYTGEDGFEVYLPAEGGLSLYEKLLEKGVKPCGLGARDVLRIEAGFPLYGRELGEDLDPREANLSRFIDLSKDFFGKEALLSREPKRRLRGLILKERRVARGGERVLRGEVEVGTVTSGTFSPNLERSIALAFLDPSVETGSEVLVEVRQRAVPAEVVRSRFVDNTLKG
ncbi:MAG: glycine cleavage system aminomethyltransferase GcvT [Aquificae bacterium]|nr:glycine cleavage system aminomethyltransferase GcvT [Aquificota bacterium]